MLRKLALLLIGLSTLAAAGAAAAYFLLRPPPPDPSYFFDPEVLEIGPDGRIYVGDEGRATVIILTPEGEVVGDVGQPHGGIVPLDESFGTPDAIAIAPDDRLVVIDGKHHAGRILICSRDLRRVERVFGSFGEAPGQLTDPEGVALDGAGLIYESDEDARRIQVYTLAGEYVRGFAVDEDPEGIDVLADGSRIAVAFSKAGIFGLFDADGHPVWRLTEAGGERLVEPESCCFSPDGSELYLGDAGNPSIVVFGLDGSYRRRIGRPGTEPGCFRSVDELAFDPSGNLVACDPDGRCLSVFRPDGTFVRVIRPVPDLAGRLR